MYQIEQEWIARRLSVPIPGTFEEVVTRFEDTIGVYPADDFAERVARVESWDRILEHTQALAPLGFLIYWKNDVDKMMALAGDPALCVSYLMGNHTIAERMFRHDPRVMNYAPLRIEITQEPGGPVVFTADQPSTQFGSFGNESILGVGIDLDHKLAVVIEAIGGVAPVILRARPAPVGA